MTTACFPARENDSVGKRCWMDGNDYHSSHFVSKMNVVSHIFVEMKVKMIVISDTFLMMS